MKYPRTPEKLDRRYKIRPSQRKKIIQLRQGGMIISKIAKKYSVSIATIRCVLYPQEREKRNECARKRNQILWRTDKKFREKVRKWGSERRKYKRKIQPQLDRYYGERITKEMIKKCNKKRWEKIRKDPELLAERNKKHLDWVNQNRDYVNKKARENYHKRKNKIK